MDRVKRSLGKTYTALRSDSELESAESKTPRWALAPSVFIWNDNLLWERAYRAICFLTFLAGAAMLLAARRISPTDQQCVSQLSAWSPLADAIEYEEVNFVNYFSHKSKFRGPPTPELEMAWHDIFEFPSISIPDSKLASINRTADDQLYVKTTAPELAPGYLAGIEVFHHLHCLNLIRQFTWLDYYDTPPLGLSDDPVANRMHVDHCIETLRLAFQCNADITPYLVIRAEGTEVGAKADFNAFHKCKKFDGIVDWMLQNSAVQPLEEGASLAHDLAHGHH